MTATAEAPAQAPARYTARDGSALELTAGPHAIFEEALEAEPRGRDWYDERDRAVALGRIADDGTLAFCDADTAALAPLTGLAGDARREQEQYLVYDLQHGSPEFAAAMSRGRDERLFSDDWSLLADAYAPVPEPSGRGWLDQMEASLGDETAGWDPPLAPLPEALPEPAHCHGRQGWRQRARRQIRGLRDASQDI